MDAIHYRYIFHLAHGTTETFDLQMDPDTLTLINPPAGTMPRWTELKFLQCRHCSLNERDHPYCPVAVNIADIVTRFERSSSYDEADLEIIVPDKGRVICHTTVQRGIGSMFGILFPASGCPHTAFFRPMARFHLPLASEEDTLFRVGGMYLLAQYFRHRQDPCRRLNFEGLERIYHNLNRVNINAAERLRYGKNTESSINAIVFLDVFTQTMPMAIESQLEEIRYLFAPYLSPG